MFKILYIILEINVATQNHHARKQKYERNDEINNENLIVSVFIPCKVSVNHQNQ